MHLFSAFKASMLEITQQELSKDILYFKSKILLASCFVNIWVGVFYENS